MIEPLVNIPLFRGVTPVEIETLLATIVYQRKKFPPDYLVVSQGEDCNRLIILIEGKVKAEMTDPTGKSLKIEDMEAPSVLASAFLFGMKSFFPVNITSTSSIELLVIQRSDLLHLFQENKQVLKNFLSMISSRAQFLSEKLRFHSFKSLKSKLAFYLLNEAGKENSFRMKHSQSDLAELFGVARPSVGRAFSQLQDEGVISVHYKQIEINDKEQLAIACHEK